MSRPLPKNDNLATLEVTSGSDSTDYLDVSDDREIVVQIDWDTAPMSALAAAFELYTTNRSDGNGLISVAPDKIVSAGGTATVINNGYITIDGDPLGGAGVLLLFYRDFGRRVRIDTGVSSGSPSHYKVNAFAR